MSGCVIFNPTACGRRAERFRELLPTLSPRPALCPTTCAGSARTLARDAVEAGHERIYAAGGDGTVFEVLNGIADAPGGFERAILGILPLGTANVLAHELGLRGGPVHAWQLLQDGVVRAIDCGLAEFLDLQGLPARAHFAIVAGAGLDARAVELVDLRLKRHAGKLAYIGAALQALFRFPDTVRCQLAGNPFRGRAVLAGNGRFYAGEVPVFGDGALDDGRLHVRGVSRVGPLLLWKCLLAYAAGRGSLDRHLIPDTVETLRLESDHPVPLQLDGERVGFTPATLRILPRALRVLTPAVNGRPSS